MIFAGENLTVNLIALRNRLVPCTRANAFGEPSREEKPAARITIRNLRKETAFIGIMRS